MSAIKLAKAALRTEIEHTLSFLTKEEIHRQSEIVRQKVNMTNFFTISDCIDFYSTLQKLSDKISFI